MLTAHLDQVDCEIDLLKKRLLQAETDAFGKHFGFKPAYTLTSQLNHMSSKFSESTVNNSAGIFLIKTVLETLDRFGGSCGDSDDSTSQGVPMSEKNIRYIFSACCKELAIKLNSKGGIAGLGFDISVVCSVLHVIGMTKLLTEQEVESRFKGGECVPAPNCPSSSTSICSTVSSESLESLQSRSILETPLITVLNNITSSIPLLFGVFPGASKPAAPSAASSSTSTAMASSSGQGGNNEDNNDNGGVGRYKGGGSASSVIVKAFVTRWSDLLTKYVKALKESADKQDSLLSSSSSGSVTLAGGSSTSAMKPSTEATASTAGATVATVSSSSVSGVLNIIDDFASDHRVWALRSNEAELSVDLSSVLEGVSPTAPMTPLSLLTSPRETLNQVQRVIYAEQVALESEEYLMRRLLARAGININEVEVGNDCDSNVAENNPGLGAGVAFGVDGQTEGLAQVPYFRLGTRYLASEYKYVKPESKRKPTEAEDVPFATAGPEALDAMETASIPTAPPTIKQLKRLRKEMRLAKAAAKELAKSEGLANRGRGKASSASPPGSSFEDLSWTDTSMNSSNIAQLYQQSFGHGTRMTAQMLIDKARKLRRHRDAFPAPFDVVTKRYHTAMETYAENNVSGSSLSNAKTGPGGLVRGYKKKNSSTAGELASSFSTLKKRRSHLLAPLAINMHAGMCVTPTGLEGSLYAAVPMGVLPTPTMAPELFTAKGNMKKGASSMDLVSLKKSNSVPDPCLGFTMPDPNVSSSFSSSSSRDRGVDIRMSKEGHIILPDLVIRTTEVPWPLVAAEFVALDYSEDLGDNNLLRRASSSSGVGSLSPSASSVTAVGLTKDGKIDRRRKRVDDAELEPQEQMQHPPKRGRGVKLAASVSNSCLNSLSPGATDSVASTDAPALRRQTSVVMAPQYHEIPPTPFGKYPKGIKQNFVAPPFVDASNSDSEEEDISDEHMLAAHDAVLASMREKWVTFGSNSPGGNGPSSSGGRPRAASASSSSNTGAGAGAAGSSLSATTGLKKGPYHVAASKATKRNLDSANAVVSGRQTPTRSDNATVAGPEPPVTKKPRGRPAKNPLKAA